MKVQIVIPAINLWSRYTKGCINSLMDAMVRAKSHNIDAHIVLIDNGSTDETQTEAPKLESELFHYHRNNERWGFQRSVNFGVAYGWANSVDYVLVCNNDIIIHPEAITRLVERADKGDAGMVTCMDVRGEMQEKGLMAGLINTLNANDKESVDEAPNPNFSAFMVGRACWEVVGEFDELFFPAYFEDNDWHYRMKLLELTAIVLPTAMFYHYGSRTQNEADAAGPMVPSPMFEATRERYVSKWGGRPGEEKFEHPYNDENKSLRSTQQNPNA